MASKRQLILEACKTRVEAIAVSAGFNTDAGEAVQLGEVTELGPDDPDAAIAVVPGEDAVKTVGHKHLVRLPIELQAIVKVDLDEPWAAVEALLADIKQAFELADRTLGGLVTQDGITRMPTRTLPREAGMTTVGVGLAYLVSYEETWGAP